jgi:hypothetical protein
VALVLTLLRKKQIRINIHKRNNTKNTVQKIQNTVNRSTHITRHPHITKQVKITTVKFKTNRVQDIPNEIVTI